MLNQRTFWAIVIVSVIYLVITFFVWKPEPSKASKAPLQQETLRDTLVEPVSDGDIKNEPEPSRVSSNVMLPEPPPVDKRAYLRKSDYQLSTDRTVITFSRDGTILSFTIDGEPQAFGAMGVTPNWNDSQEWSVSEFLVQESGSALSGIEFHLDVPAGRVVKEYFLLDDSRLVLHVTLPPGLTDYRLGMHWDRAPGTLWWRSGNAIEQEQVPSEGQPLNWAAWKQGNHVLALVPGSGSWLATLSGEEESFYLRPSGATPVEQSWLLYSGPARYATLAGYGLQALGTEVRDDIVLENEYMSIVFTNRGAKVKSVLVHDYKMGESDQPVNLVPEGRFISTLSGIRIQDEDIVDIVFEPVVHEHSVEFLVQGAENDPLFRLMYTIEDRYNVALEIFAADDPRIEFAAKGNLEQYYRIHFTGGIARSEAPSDREKEDFRFVADVNFETEKLTIETLDDSDEKRIFTGDIGWAGIRSMYFAQILIPDASNPLQEVHPDRVVLRTTDEEPLITPVFTGIVQAPDSAADAALNHIFKLYLGPLAYEQLEVQGNGIENIADMGWSWLRFLSRFFHWLLGALHEIFPNWGVCIILFALIVKLLLYPISRNQTKHMMKMQEEQSKIRKLQPKMDELKRKYGKDPRVLREEQQKLFKEHGVNPFAGCQPGCVIQMLLQMPVFFALYPVLRYSIDLRQAHFVGWVTDLSQPDPYYVLPILMAVFMFLQQKLMETKPSENEPLDENAARQQQTQKMMRWMMPVMMLIFFHSFPAGLVLYWMFFNIFSIAQSYLQKKALAKKK